MLFLQGPLVWGNRIRAMAPSSLPLPHSQRRHVYHDEVRKVNVEHDDEEEYKVCLQPWERKNLP